MKHKEYIDISFVPWLVDSGGMVFNLRAASLNSEKRRLGYFAFDLSAMTGYSGVSYYLTPQSIGRSK